MLTQEGLAGGLFHDGSAFVLQNVGLKTTSSFMIVGAKDLVPRNTITLKGTFGFDALSPDGSRLYLIQHTSVRDIQHYIVRVYDLKTRKLLPGRVADKSQQSWVMQGFAVDRVTTRRRPLGVHALLEPGWLPVRARARHRARRRALHRRSLARQRERAVEHAARAAQRRQEPRRQPADRRDVRGHRHRELEDLLSERLGQLDSRCVREELEQELADLIRLTEREVVIRVDLHESRAGHRARDSTVDLLQAGRVE